MSALKFRVAAIAAPAIAQAMQLLPRNLDNGLARVILSAIALQESELIHRRQLGNGPARGLWQFELGSAQKGGGVRGVYLHKASARMLKDLCAVRGVDANPKVIWAALETDDVFAAGVARLLMWTDRAQLPRTQSGAWALYNERCWCPGKPHPEDWPANWQAAWDYGIEVGWVSDKGVKP